MKRRQLLGAAAGGALSATALAGCGLFDDDDPAPPPDPLQPLLDEALQLAAGYDRLSLAQPGLTARLTPLADDHRVHAAELSRLIGAPPSGAPASAAPAADSLASLRKAERLAQKTAAAACLRAPADRAGLTGSIAAARAAHAEALR